MHAQRLLGTLAAVMATPALGMIMVDYYASSDCSDDIAKSTEIDPGSDQYTCIATNSDYSALKLSGDDSTTLVTCGPYCEDGACEFAFPDSETHTCGDCSAFAGTSYVRVEQEL